MSVSNLEELEEELSNILPRGFTIETDNNGQLVIYTGLSSDEDGELMEFEDDEDEDESFDVDDELSDDELDLE
jgi:hypothetical protein